MTRTLFPRLSDAKLEWLGKRGERRSFQPGEVLYEHGARDAPFYILESGRVEFIDRKPGKDVYIAEADSHTFIGDIAVFTGEPTISACVAVEQTDVIVFDRRTLRDMVAHWPEFGEHVFRTLMARRTWHETEGHDGAPVSDRDHGTRRPGRPHPALLTASHCAWVAEPPCRRRNAATPHRPTRSGCSAPSPPTSLHLGWRHLATSRSAMPAAFCTVNDPVSSAWTIWICAPPDFGVSVIATPVAG